MLTLYGGSTGRASRSLWALEELGVPYRHAPLRPWAEPADLEIIRRLNPNGRVPILQDGALVLWESMAINLYLADRYGGGLWPTDPGDRGGVYMWSLWSQTEIDVPARHRARRSDDPKVKAGAEAARLAALQVLEDALTGRAHLLGEAFTLADLNVAGTLSEPQEKGWVDGDLDLSKHGMPRLADWLSRCQARDSWARVCARP
jgi:glutathione S-transferase